MTTTKLFITAIAAVMLATAVTALPAMRRAPQQCPVRSGNLVDPVLFVENATSCQDLCSRNERCLFFYYFPGSGNTQSENAVDQPSQCFLYDECVRSVLPATENCPVKRENTVGVDAFVRDADHCEKSCSMNAGCSYFLYYDEEDERQPQMCYHLKSCSRRVIRDRECPLEENNYIDHLMFTSGTEACMQKCEELAECRFYHWYPIDYSPAPLYCYLYRSCEGGADEPHVALVASGRHPGYYFLDQNAEESLDVVRTEATCEKAITPEGSAVGRAGAVSEFAHRRVLLCGGRDFENEVRSDCLAYDPLTNEWESYNTLLSAREEAATAVIRPEAGADGDMYIMGGFIDGQRTASVDRLPRDRDAGWESSVALPEPRSRFCSVAVSADIIAVVGGETGDVDADGELMATPDMKTLNVGDGEWITQPGMAQARKDHACLMAEIDGDKGILVTGGVDENDNLLDSVEFYSLTSEAWQSLRSLKQPRTEHGMAWISGMATVMGGVSSEEFLKSIEFLDNSAEEDAEMGMDWRIAAHELTRPRYDFTVAAVPISALPQDERMMDKCYDLADVQDNEFV